MIYHMISIAMSLRVPSLTEWCIGILSESSSVCDILMPVVIISWSSNEFQIFRSCVRFIPWCWNHIKLFLLWETSDKMFQNVVRSQRRRSFIDRFEVTNGDLAVKNTEFSLINFQSENFQNLFWFHWALEYRLFYFCG